MTEEIKKSYYAVIPANVRYDPNLNANSKLIYGEITALTNEKGYCWASNEYFASLYRVSKKTISLWIKDLKDNGYIDVKLIYKEGSKQIVNRYLQICNEGTNKNVNTPTPKNVKENNTLINNKDNNKRNIKENEGIDNLVSKYTKNKELLKTLNDFFDMRKEIKSRMTFRAVELLLNNLDKLANSDKEKILILEQSIQNGWKGVFALKGSDFSENRLRGAKQCHEENKYSSVKTRFENELTAEERERASRELL